MEFGTTSPQKCTLGHNRLKVIKTLHFSYNLYNLCLCSNDVLKHIDAQVLRGSHWDFIANIRANIGKVFSILPPSLPITPS